MLWFTSPPYHIYRTTFYSWKPTAPAGLMMSKAGELLVFLGLATFSKLLHKARCKGADARCKYEVFEVLGTAEEYSDLERLQVSSRLHPDSRTCQQMTFKLIFGLNNGVQTWLSLLHAQYMSSSTGTLVNRFVGDMHYKRYSTDSLKIWKTLLGHTMLLILAEEIARFAGRPRCSLTSVSEGPTGECKLLNYFILIIVWIF